VDSGPRQLTQSVLAAPHTPDEPEALLIVAHGAHIVNTTGLQVKPHLFTHTKHRIAQLNTLLSQRQQ
jgi:hypothetical protein